jgi:predicted TIM-barrel fold metal-dependent hydrolase
MRGSRKLLPSEYFARQCFGAFWFESTTLPLLGLYPDSFLFSTDYPHPTSVSPGPCSPSMPPREHIETHFQDVPEDVRAKVLSLNAARLYGVDIST